MQQRQRAISDFVHGNRGEDSEELGKNEAFFTKAIKGNFDKTMVRRTPFIFSSSTCERAMS